MRIGWEMAASLILTPLLVLSQSPWSELGMFLVRVVVSVVFVLSLRMLFRVWWGRRGGEGGHYLSGWMPPLALAGVGLLLLCSPRWGGVDRLFTQADRTLMNTGISDTTLPDGDWYRLFVDVGSVRQGASPEPSLRMAQGVTTHPEGRISTPAGERGEEHSPVPPQKDSGNPGER